MATYRADLPASHFGGSVVAGIRDEYTNLVKLTPAASGAAVAVEAVGDDSAINLRLVPKSTGNVQLGATTSVAVLMGGGTAASPLSTSTADKNFLGFWTQSTATSGDSRGLYLRHYLGAAGSGEALRVFGTATAANVATGGTANGAHISFSLSGASASISGQAHACRLTLGADAQTRTLNGNMAVLNLDSDVATGNTVPDTVGFIKVTDTNSVRINTLFTLPAVANGTLIAAHTAQTNTHSIKIVSGSTVYYIPCHATATGRS